MQILQREKDREIVDSVRAVVSHKKIPKDVGVKKSLTKSKNAASSKPGNILTEQQLAEAPKELKK